MQEGVPIGSTTISGVGYPTNDTPAIAWNPVDQTYRLALRQGFSAIYSFKSTPPATTWVGTGDIVNGSIAPISTPSLSTTASGNLTAWWMKWW
jgi:hypothetical protein